MAHCDLCKKLVGAKSDVAPHEKLKYLGTSEYKGEGFRTAYVERYRCTECKTPWQRDMDKRDSGAIWEEDATRS